MGSTLVNCTNSYDSEKPDPQLVELAKYAKQHVPEEHPKVTCKNCLLQSCRSTHHMSFDNLLVLGSGCPFICGETVEETAGGGCGVCVGVHGQTREPCPHGCMQGMYRQVRIMVGWASFSTYSLFSLAAVSHCRVFLALVEKQEDRGAVVAQGGGKVYPCNVCS